MQFLIRRLRALEREDLEPRFRAELSLSLDRRQLTARILTVQGRSANISIRVRADGKEIRGAWTTNKDCKIKPGIPSLADLEWTPVKGKDKAPKFKVKRSNF